MRSVSELQLVVVVVLVVAIDLTFSGPNVDLLALESAGDSSRYKVSAPDPVLCYRVQTDLGFEREVPNIFLHYCYQLSQTSCMTHRIPLE